MKNVLHYQILVSTIHGEIPKHHRETVNLKSQLQYGIKIELSDGSYSVSGIQDYFEYIIKKHETVTDNLSMKVYFNKTENRITFKIKTRYYFELLTPETMKMLGSTENKTTEVKW